MDTQERSTTLDIAIGTIVACRDGHAGRVSKLAVEPDSRLITHVIVEYGLPYQQQVVPIERVAGVHDHTLYLDLDRADLAALPRFAEVDYALPDASWPAHLGYSQEIDVVDAHGYTPNGLPLAHAWGEPLVSGHTHRGLPAEDVPIGHGTRITCRDGLLGRLDHVLLDPETDAVRALVVRRGYLPGRDVVVPAGRVEWIAEDEVHLDADRAALEGLPEYHEAGGDDQTAAEVENGLLTGSEVVRAVAEALAHDPRTARAMVDATESGGSLTLRGQVRSVGEKQAAVAIARSVTGVVAVMDELEIHTEAARREGLGSQDSVLALSGRLSPLK